MPEFLLSVLQQNRIKILNTSIDNLSMEETLGLIQEKIERHEQIHHVAVNAGKMVQMQKNIELRQSVNGSDLISADGQAVIWASRFLKKPLKERVAGIDLMQHLMALAHENNYKVFLFGAKEEVVSKVTDIYTKKYNNGIIAGYRNGYFSSDDEQTIAHQIAASGAQMLFVAITSPIKENFLHNHKDILKNVNLIMGVGGSFDVAAGITKRAPLWMQNIGMEWFYRFLQEPKRMWRRYLIGNTKFILLVLKEKFRK